MKKITLRLRAAMFAATLFSGLFAYEARANISLSDVDEYVEQNYISSGWKGETSGSSYGWKIYSDYCYNNLSSSGTAFSLFSPAIDVEGGNIYTFNFNIYNDTSYPESTCEIYLLSAPQAGSSIILRADNVYTDRSNKSVDVSFEFEPETNQTVYFSVKDVSSWYTGDKTGMKNFSIKKEISETVPNKVTHLTATPGANNAKSVTLNWTNPTNYNTGEELSIAKILVSRNDQLIATLSESEMVAAGAQVSYEDSFEQSGVYTYRIVVEDSEGLQSSTSMVKTPYVGEFEGLDVPYEYDPYDEAINSFYKIETPENTVAWQFNDKVIDISLSYLQPLDSYLFTPGFRLDPNKAYKVSFNAKAMRPANIIKLSFGTTAEPTSASEVNFFIPLEQFYPEADKTLPYSFEFTPAVTDTDLTYFVWHAQGEQQLQSFYNNTITLSDIKIEELPIIPTPATDVTATAAEDKSVAITVKWTNPSVSPTGLPLSGLTANIERDGEVVATGVACEGETSEYIDNVDLSEGYHTYRVIICNENGSADPSEAVKSDYTGAALTIPFTSDFTSNPFVWTGIQPNEETANDREWTITNGKATLSENKGETTDDILLLPPLTLSSTVPYEFTLNAACGTYQNVPFKIVVLDEETGEWTPLYSNNSLGYSATNYSFRFGVEKDGDYSLGLYAVPGSAYSSFTITVNTISIVEAPFVPGEPQEVSALMDTETEDAVIVSWTMPMTTPEGVALSGELYVEVYRGNAVSGEAAFSSTGEPGEEMEWRDTEAVTGLNNYVIVVSIDSSSEEKTSVNVTSDFFAKAVNVPYSSDFSDEGVVEWTILDGYAYSSNKFEPAVSDSGENYLFLNESSFGNLDDWVVTPLLNFEKGGEYKITIEASATAPTSTYYSYTVDVEAYLADANDITTLRASEKLPVAVEEEDAAADVADNTKHSLTTERTSYSFTHSLVVSEQSARRASSAESSRKFIGFNFKNSSWTSGASTTSLYSVKIERTNDDTVTGIETALVEKGKLSVIEGIVYASEQDATIYVYTLTGALVTVEKGSFELDKLTKGVYVLRDSNNSTLKVVR